MPSAAPLIVKPDGIASDPASSDASLLASASASASTLASLGCKGVLPHAHITNAIDNPRITTEFYRNVEGQHYGGNSMPHVQTALNDNSNYMLEVVTVSGSCALTLVTIKTSGAMSAECLINPNGMRAIANGSARLVFVLTGPPSQSGTFKITQNAQTFIDVTWGSSSPVDLIVTCDIV